MDDWKVRIVILDRGFVKVCLCPDPHTEDVLMCPKLVEELKFIRADVKHLRETVAPADYLAFLRKLRAFVSEEIVTAGGADDRRWAGEPNTARETVATAWGGVDLAGIDDAA